MPNPYPGRSREEIAALTYDRRRLARFKAARNRVQKIVEGEPALTEEQRAQLALLLHPEGAGK